MHQAMFQPIRIGVPLAVVLALSAGDVRAITQVRRFHSTATSLCQAALSAYETSVRKRPLVLQNEGSSDVFVTCAFTGQWSQLGNVTSVVIGFRSANSTAATVTCSGVTGTIGSSQANLYVTKSVTLPGANAVGWSGNDYDTGDGTIPGNFYFSVSCKLPPGVGITSTGIQFEEDIGD